MNYRKIEDERAFFGSYDPLKKMDEEAFIKADLRTYFIRYSKTYEAIVKHIGEASDCVLIKRDKPILCSSAQGPHISFSACHRYPDNWIGNKSTPSKVYCLSLRVTMVDEEEARYSDYPTRIDKRFDIQVPIDLELNFSQRKFDAWIKDLRQKRDAELEKVERKQLAELLKKYPR